MFPSLDQHFSVCGSAPWGPKTRSGVCKVKTTFIIIMRCYLPCSLSWYLCEYCKTNGGWNCWQLRTNPAVVPNGTSRVCHNISVSVCVCIVSISVSVSKYTNVLRKQGNSFLLNLDPGVYIFSIFCVGSMHKTLLLKKRNGLRTVIFVTVWVMRWTS